MRKANMSIELVRKNVMKIAWRIKKLDSRNLFSECLKMAWKGVKEKLAKSYNVTKALVTGWFYEKTFGASRFDGTVLRTFEIEKETEKAVLLTKGGESFWCPKSCIEKQWEAVVER